MKFQVKYRGDNGEDQYSTRSYSFDRSSLQLSNWGFSCINVCTKISEDFGHQAVNGMEMNSIEISRMDGFEEDVYVDNVWIGRKQLLGNILKQRFSVKSKKTM